MVKTLKKKQRGHHQEMLASFLGFTNHSNVWIQFCQKKQKSDIGFTLRVVDAGLWTPNGALLNLFWYVKRKTVMNFFTNENVFFSVVF